MREALKSIVQRVMAKTPFRIVRAPENRFQAIPLAMENLARMGYRPKLIIDGGAHLGAFAELAHEVFPSASIHMVDPQPACQKDLIELADRTGFKLHSVALAATHEMPGGLGMATGDTPSTGAYVDPTSSTRVPTATLDTLFVNLEKVDRAFLKMDLQGYELEALRGARTILPSIEVILTEVSFFRQAYEPKISDLISFLDDFGFELFDIAALWSRTRDNRAKQGDLVFVRSDSPLACDSSWE